MGCPLVVTIEDGGDIVSVTGNTCKRGEIYRTRRGGTNPTRIVTSTVRVSGGSYRYGVGEDKGRYSEGKDL